MEDNTRDEFLNGGSPIRLPQGSFIGRIVVFLLEKRLKSRVSWALRWTLLNRQPGIHVDWMVNLAESAKLELNLDGYESGGQIYISPRVRISEGVILAPFGGSIHIGENVYVGPYCVFYGHGGLTIGKNTLIAAHTVIIPGNHGVSRVDIPIRIQNVTKLGVRIGEDVWIGSGVQVLDGVSIGKGCVIGAGSVVKKSLDDYSVAVGVPAKVIRKRR